jgi:aryl-alcohol dehydrogenase-like predicted oxidoreductase
MTMKTQPFGRLGQVSVLTLGGGGLGQLWGPTTREECVATVKAAVDAGITLIDLAPRYGDGKAEQVVGAAFGGRLPAGVRVTSKCNLGNPPPERIERILRQSIEASLRLTQLDRLDLFFLHSNIVPRGNPMWRRVDTSRFVPLEVFQQAIRPLFEKFVTEGTIGAWGVTGIGHPDAIIDVLGETPKPARCRSLLIYSTLQVGLNFSTAQRNHGRSWRWRVKMGSP